MNETHENDKWELLRFLLRAVLLAAFGLTVLFWLIVAFYLADSLLRGDVQGAGLWLLSVGQQRWDPPCLYTKARWGLVVGQFSAIALLTILLWLANRRTIRNVIESWRRNA